jgi:hypothetical protein
MSEWLEWIDGRWHVEGRGIHAGDHMEIRWPDGFWEAVRIETTNQGTVLGAYFEHHGELCCVRIDDKHHRLRWPGNPFFKERSSCSN